MIRIAISLVLMAILGWLMPLIGPWYHIALAGAVGGLLIGRTWLALLLGLLVGATLWYVQTYFLQQASPSDLPERMAQLMNVGNAQNLKLLTAAIGGLVMGLGAAVGASLKGLLK